MSLIVNAEMTVNDLMSMVMRKKNTTGKELSKKMNCSESHVTQVLRNSKNHWIQTVTDFFNGLDEDFEILDKNKNPYSVPNTIVTMGQLRRATKDFYFKFKSNGHVYRIVPYENWNE